MDADTAWETQKDDVFNVVADIDLPSARIQYAFLAGYIEGERAALGAREDVERLRAALREIICDLYAEDTISTQRMNMAVKRARAALATSAPHDASEGG